MNLLKFECLKSIHSTKNQSILFVFLVVTIGHLFFIQNVSFSHWKMKQTYIENNLQTITQTQEQIESDYQRASSDEQKSILTKLMEESEEIKGIFERMSISLQTNNYKDYWVNDAKINRITQSNLSGESDAINYSS